MAIFELADYVLSVFGHLKSFIFRHSHKGGCPYGRCGGRPAIAGDGVVVDVESAAYHSPVKRAYQPDTGSSGEGSSTEDESDEEEEEVGPNDEEELRSASPSSSGSKHDEEEEEEEDISADDVAHADVMEEIDLNQEDPDPSEDGKQPDPSSLFQERYHDEVLKMESEDEAEEGSDDESEEEEEDDEVTSLSLEEPPPTGFWSSVNRRFRKILHTEGEGGGQWGDTGDYRKVSGRKYAGDKYTDVQANLV